MRGMVRASAASPRPTHLAPASLGAATPAASPRRPPSAEARAFALAASPSARARSPATCAASSAASLCADALAASASPSACACAAHLLSRERRTWQSTAEVTGDRQSYFSGPTRTCQAHSTSHPVGRTCSDASSSAAALASCAWRADSSAPGAEGGAVGVPVGVPPPVVLVSSAMALLMALFRCVRASTSPDSCSTRDLSAALS